MPTMDQVWEQLQLITARLATLQERCDLNHQRLDDLQHTLDAGLATLANGLHRNLEQQERTQEQLALQAVQNRTVICGLDKISRDTRLLANLGDLRPQFHGELVGGETRVRPAA